MDVDTIDKLMCLYLHLPPCGFIDPNLFSIVRERIDQHYMKKKSWTAITKSRPIYEDSQVLGSRQKTNCVLLFVNFFIQVRVEP